MITNSHKDIAQWAMETALKHGCSAARVSITMGYNNSLEYRNDQLDKLHQSSENRLYIELYVDGRYGSLSTNRLDRSELDQFIKEGVISTRFLAKDECRQLPTADRYYINKANRNLELFDSTFFDYTIDQKLDIIKSSVNEIYATDDRIISVVSAYDDGCGAEYMVASNGFEGIEEDTAFSLMTEVVLKTDTDARPEAYHYDSQLYWQDLQKDDIAKIAFAKALRKIGQSKVKSGKYNIVLDNTVSSRLLSPLISAMYGTAIQQKNTFLLNKLGEKITSDKLTIYDVPHSIKTFGARWYDGEGVATKEQIIIENGILNTYFIDTYNSLKLPMQATIASPSVVKLNQGQHNCDALIKLMHKGLLITGFNGGNTNSTTGDFSFGIEGFLVENGIISKPISEMNITGNILELWNNLVEIGNDPFSSCSSRQIPSLLFENVSVSGL